MPAPRINRAAAGIACLFLAAGCASAPRPQPGIAYSSYLGGSGDDAVQGIAVAPDGTLYLAGATNSPDFPGRTPAGEETGRMSAFVSVFAPGGQELLYTIIMGGGGNDYAESCALTPEGNLAVTGKTLSKDFPTREAFQGAPGGRGDAFFTLFSSGGELLVSSFLGGSRPENLRAPGSVAVDGNGRIFLAGTTASADFPEVNPIPETRGKGSAAFLVLLDPSGRRVLSSLRIGGEKMDFCYDLAVDRRGRPLLTGQTASADFPRAGGGQAYLGQPGYTDAFIALLDENAAGLVYSGCLGGTGWDFGYGAAFSPEGDIIIAGRTDSRDFPTVRARQGAYAGGAGDLFVARIEPESGETVFSTYLGGAGDDPAMTWARIAIEPGGRIWLGTSSDSGDFPGADPLPKGNDAEVTVAALSPDGQTLEFSQLLGGSSHDLVRDIACGSNAVYLAGITYSGDFPTLNPFQGLPGSPQPEDGEENYTDAFFLKIPIPGEP